MEVHQSMWFANSIADTRWPNFAAGINTSCGAVVSSF